MTQVDKLVRGISTFGYLLMAELMVNVVKEVVSVKILHAQSLPGLVFFAQGFALAGSAIAMVMPTVRSASALKLWAKIASACLVLATIFQFIFACDSWAYAGPFDTWEQESYKILVNGNQAMFLLLALLVRGWMVKEFWMLNKIADKSGPIGAYLLLADPSSAAATAADTGQDGEGSGAVVAGEGGSVRSFAALTHREWRRTCLFGLIYTQRLWMGVGHWVLGDGYWGPNPTAQMMMNWFSLFACIGFTIGVFRRGCRRFWCDHDGDTDDELPSKRHVLLVIAFVVMDLIAQFALLTVTRAVPVDSFAPVYNEWWKSEGYATYCVGPIILDIFLILTGSRLIPFLHALN